MMSEHYTRSFFCFGIILMLVLVPVAQTISPNFLQPQTASATSGISNAAIYNVQHTNKTITTSPYTITISNFGVGTNPGRLLAVAVEANNQSVNSITFTVGSETFALTEVAGSFKNDYTAFWYLKNPLGTGNITVTMAGSTSVVVGAYALYNVDQANPIPTTATNYTVSDLPINPNPNISLTTEFPHSVVLDSAATYGGGTLGSPSCAKEWDVNMTNKITGASSNTTRASAGTVTCTWKNSVSNGWDDAAIEVKSAGFAPQTSPIVLNSRSTASGNVSAASEPVTLYNFSAGTGSNRLLVVGIAAGHQSASSVKFGGVSLTKAVSHFINNDAEFWYLTNPSYTPANIVVTMAGATEPSAFVIGAYSFANVNQTSPIGNTTTNYDTCTPSCTNPSVTITTKSPNDLVLDQVSIWGGKSLSLPTCNQQWDSNVQMSSLHKTTGASSSTIVPVQTTVTCSWTASGTSDFWDDVAVEIKAVSLSTSTGILEPLYNGPYTSYPCSSHTCFAWNSVNATKHQHPNVPIFAIVNPNSGPCYTGSGNTCSYNRQFANGIGNLTNQGIIVLGYVFTGYGNPHYNDNVHCCPYGTPQGNVTQWATMYGPQNATFASKGIKGILFDGMNYPGSGTTTGTETYYQNLTSYAKNIEGFTYTIGNPGSPTGTNYVNSGAADTIDIFEQQNAIPNIQNDLVPDTFANLGGVNYGFDKHDFSFLTYNQTSLPPSTTIGNQSNYVGLMFYSNTTSCCPFDVWGKIPPYLSNLTAILDKKTSEITINSTGPSGPVTGLLVQISQNGTVVPSGYTPYSYLGTQGVKYTFTPQNSAACTFDHWRDTSSGTAARAITVNSTSKAFTVVYTGTNCK